MQRRWFVNSRRQTFVKIEGPVEFRMGSPENEPDRSYNETPDRRVISHRFAIATKEVTVEQYQEFVKANPGVDHAQQRPVQSRSERPHESSVLVSCRGLLQLAQRGGGPAQGPVVLPAQRAEEVRQGDEGPRRFFAAQGLPLANRGGMGVCEPRCGYDQPALWPLGRSAGAVCPVSGQQPQPCLALWKPDAQRSGLIRHAWERV